MKLAERPTDYHFLLPQVRTRFLGDQGEAARYIPYCLEEEVTCETLLQELARQPHMKPLTDRLDADRRLYLLESDRPEVLQLAAAYIGTYHRLAHPEQEGYAGEEDCDDAAFRFADHLPFLQSYDLDALFDSDGFGLGGGQWYRSENQTRGKPWWMMNEEAPLCLCIGHNFRELSNQIAALEQRSLLILLYHRPQHPLFASAASEDILDNLSFELETEVISLLVPAADSPYKQEVFCQLARQQKSVPVCREEVPLILTRIAQSRRNIDNATISKALTNALIRRKKQDTSPLCLQDFRYLTLRADQTGSSAADGQAEQELIGQADVRRQLEQIIDNLVFQKRREGLGLPFDPIHYTFAFLGAPGTGKTTWAMWLAREMRKRDLLENTNMICLNAAELKAKYVGHTTDKVKSLFEQYGVILLDEAYSLTDGRHGDSFGAEALSQLCVELENHSTDRLVIFAGYGGADNPEDDRMLRFFRSNPGIQSRIAFKIHFSNFEPEELAQVFGTMMAGYDLPDGYAIPVTRFFRDRLHTRAFGNCREARNLADRVKIELAARLAHTEDLTRETACRVTMEDIRTAIGIMDREAAGLTESQRRMGF